MTGFWPEGPAGETGFTFTKHRIRAKLPDTRRLRRWLSAVLEAEGVPEARVDYIFCTDEYLLEINRTYLDHDTYTDIITFPLGESPLAAEIYISHERVRDNAARLGVPEERELLRVIVHGLLHLCGYDDHTPAGKRRMRRRETLHIDRF